VKDLRYPALDGLRAVAVLIVLAGHGGSSFLKSGGIGVDIFFVLSGFLITGILSREAGAAGRISLGNFYARRFLRLVPCLVLVCAFVVLWCLLRGEPMPGMEVAAALTYTANWARALFDADLSYLAHSWSLAIEEQYYLLWPFAILALERSAKSPMAKGGLILALALLLAAYRFAMVGTFTPQRIYFGLDTHMDGLLLGSALAYFVPALRARGGLTEVQSRVLGFVLVPMAIAGLVAITQLMTWTHPWMGRLGFLLVAFAAFFIIADLVAGAHSLTRPVLNVRPMAYLGRISYGLYLWHYPVYLMIDRAFADSTPMQLLPAKVGLSVAAAMLSFHLVEVRFLALKALFERPAPQVGDSDAGKLSNVATRIT